MTALLVDMASPQGIGQIPAPVPVKIDVQAVDLAYDVRQGKLYALRNTNLQVQQGEFTCFVGPSGCGKSTLLFLLAGLLRPTAGQILLDGRPVAGPGADRAMVFQDDAVFPWLTVERNVEYGLRIRSMAAQGRRQVVDHYLEMVGLDGVRHLYPRELSGGMRKRVDMARAFANDPQVLLMDEPFGMLDAFTKERLQQETMRIWEETRKTICFVTHDLEEALFLADRVFVFQGRPGRVHQVMEVPFARPRDVRLKTTPEFQVMRRDLLDLMAELTARSGEEGDGHGR